MVTVVLNCIIFLVTVVLNCITFLAVLYFFTFLATIALNCVNIPVVLNCVKMHSQHPQIALKILTFLSMKITALLIHYTNLFANGNAIHIKAVKQYKAIHKMPYIYYTYNAKHIQVVEHNGMSMQSHHIPPKTWTKNMPYITLHQINYTIVCNTQLC